MQFTTRDVFVSACKPCIARCIETYYRHSFSGVHFTYLYITVIVHVLRVCKWRPTFHKAIRRIMQYDGDCKDHSLRHESKSRWRHINQCPRCWNTTSIQVLYIRCGMIKQLDFGWLDLTNGVHSWSCKNPSRLMQKLRQRMYGRRGQMFTASDGRHMMRI